VRCIQYDSTDEIRDKLSPGAKTAALQGGDTRAFTVIHLLVPIKDACEVIPGARYAKSLIDRQVPVKVNLLHVARSTHSAGSILPFLKNIRDPEEDRANSLITEAAGYLIQHNVPHRTFILSGRVVPAILEAAVMLGCRAIVLQAMKDTSWRRPLAQDTVRKIVSAAGSVPVVLVDINGRDTTREDGVDFI
jgi:hypothetical protein